MAFDNYRYGIKPLGHVFKCVVAALMLSACAAPLPIAFNARAAAYVLEPGDNSISGRAYLVSKSGYVRNCYDDNVHLIPVTPYSTEWMTRAFAGATDGYTSSPHVEEMPRDEEFIKYQRSATCDASGNFIFEHVSDGKYYVFATVFWLLRWQHNGGGLMTEVEVQHGAHQNVALVKAS